MLNYLILPALLVFASCIQPQKQTIVKTYSGGWAETYWTFSFKQDGTYNRKSSGHYGNTNVMGTYIINKDTIQLLTGFENSSGTINEKYLIENDSLIIDLELLYDYKLESANNSYNIYHNSQKRYDILATPNTDSIIILSKQQFDALINSCTALLKKHRIIEIEDADHIKIIRLINTINMGNDPIFNKGIYANFINLTNEMKYEAELSNYHDWVPNRGMGFYFQKLQIELGGTPRPYSRYTINI